MIANQNTTYDKQEFLKISISLNNRFHWNTELSGVKYRARQNAIVMSNKTLVTCASAIAS